MSSNCPPQLHLSLPTNTTSFKRSFEQFGFDLDSPDGATDGAGASGSDGNDRNKRARSASSFSDDTDSIGSSQSSTVASGSSGMSVAGGNDADGDAETALSASRSSNIHGAMHYPLSLARSSQEPPRLPTPEIQDIEMADYPLAIESESSPSALNSPHPSQADENYRLSLERFHAFDSHISALRRSRSRSPTLARSTSPPVLPPLELLGDPTRLNPNAIPFMHPPAQPSSPPLPESLYNFGAGRPPRSGSSAGRDDPRSSPHEISNNTESSSQHGQRRSLSRFSNASRSTSQPGTSGASQEESQHDTAPWIEFSPDVLWSRYDESSSPGSDEQDFEFRNNLMPTLDALRSPSPLFEDLEDLRPSPGRSIPPNPPTLPPIDDNDSWGFEDIVPYSPNATRQDSSRTAGPSSSASGFHTQPTLNRISIPRSIPIQRDENSTPSSSENGMHTHTLPSPFLRELNEWMEPGSSVFDLEPEWPTSPARENMPSTSNVPSRNSSLDLSGQSRMNARETAEALWGPLRSGGRPGSENTSTRPHARESSGSGSRVSLDELRLSLGRSLAPMERSNLGVQQSEQTYVPRRLRFSPVSSPLEDMAPWLAGEERPSTSQNTSEQNTGRRSWEEEAEGDSRPSGASDRWSPSILRAGRGETTLSSHGRAPSLLSGLRRHTTNSRLAPRNLPLNDNDSDSETEVTARPTDSAPQPASHNYFDHVFRDDMTPPPQSEQPAQSREGDSTFSSLGGSSPNRPTWSWADNTTVETHEMPPTPPTFPTPSSAFSSATAQNTLRFRSRMHGTHPRLGSSNSLVTENASELRNQLIRSELLQRANSYSSAGGRQLDAIRGPALFTGSRPTLYDTMRRTSPSRPLSERLLANRHSMSRTRDPPQHGNDPQFRLGLGMRRIYAGDHSRSPNSSSDNLLDHAVDMESGAPLSYSQRLAARFADLPSSDRHHQAPRTEGTHARRFFSDVTPAPPAAHHRAPEHNPYFRSLYPSDSTESHQNPSSLNQPNMSMNHGEHRRQESNNPVSSRFGDGPFLNTLDLDVPSPSLYDIFDHDVGSPERSRESRSSSINSRPAGGPGASFRQDLGRNVREGRDGLALPPRERPELTYAGAPLLSLHEELQNYTQTLREERARRMTSFHDRQAYIQARASPPPPPSREESRGRGTQPPPRQNPPSQPTSSGTSATRAINPNSFAPGPFRNTMQRLLEVNLPRENPNANTNAPSIPPLAFDRLPPLPGGLSSYQREDNSDHQATHEWSGWSPVGTNYDDEPSSAESNRPDPWSGRPRRHSNAGPWPRYPSAPMAEGSRRQAPVDVHNYLIRQARLEGSRIENPEAPHPRGDADGFSHAIEVLRQDGLSTTRSHQLITRYHRDRERSAADARSSSTSGGSSSSPWGIVDSSSVNSHDSRPADDNPYYAWGDTPAGPHETLGSRNRTPSNPAASREMDRERLAAHARARRTRFMRHHELGPMVPPNGPIHDYLGRLRRGRALGDYVRDEDFDESYESLITLAAVLGDVKPRATPDSVIAGMETGLYKDWKTPDSDHRCPICLDDYQSDDPVLKLSDCSHWLHRECLQQWLKGASTCPVCRKVVGTSRRSEPPHHHHHHHQNSPGPSWRRGDPSAGPGGSGGSGGSSNGSSGGSGDWPPPPWRFNQGA